MGKTRTASGYCGLSDNKEGCSKKTGYLATINQQVSFLVRQSYDDAEQCKNTGSENCNAGGDLGGSTKYDETATSGKNGPYTFNPETDLAQGWIGVASLDKDGKPTHMTTASLRGIAGSLPLRSANYANDKIKGNLLSDTDWNISTDEDIRNSMSYYVTMADGTTKTTYINLGEPTQDVKGSQWWDVPFTVPGTSFTDKLTFISSNAESYIQNYKTKLSKAIKETSKSGMVQVTYQEPEGAIDYSKIDKMAYDSKPIGQNGVEKYKPFGSDEETRYICENILARHQLIDLSKYDTPSSADLTTIYNELINQSAYINAAVRSHANKGITMRTVSKGDGFALYVQYADDVQQTYDTLYNKVSEVSAGITGGNSADGVAQIENWLAANSEYDYDAFNYAETVTTDAKELMTKFPYAWSTGTLLQGKGVCMSYASMFDAIADQVGIESYVVIGKGDGVGHAWDRVKLDGQFYDTDPTWDDVGAVADSVYRLKPANKLGKHTTGSDTWLPYDKIDSYGGANSLF